MHSTESINFQESERNEPYIQVTAGGEKAFGVFSGFGNEDEGMTEKLSLGFWVFER